MADNQRNRDTYGDVGYGSDYNRGNQGSLRGGYGDSMDYGDASGGAYGGAYSSDYGAPYGSTMGSSYGNRAGGNQFTPSWSSRARQEADTRSRNTGDRREGGNFRGRGPRNYSRSAERIREDVCERLTEDPTIDATNMDIRVEGNEVILTGSVHTRDEKRRAEDLAESIRGVANVQNNLRIERGD